MELISKPFGWLMYLCYSIVSNYGIALILFTLMTKIILFPLSVKQQKNTARMAALNPKLEKLKKKYGSNKEKYNEEMMKLYGEENVNPMSGCLPLLIQMPILFGLYYVIYQPLTYILRFGQGTIDKAIEIINDNKDAFSTILNNKNFDNRPEIFIIDAVNKNPEKFKDLGTDFISKVNDFDFTFLGINLGDIPTLSWNILILIPILSFITNLGYTFYSQYKSKKNNPNMQQMGMGMNAVLYIMPIFSAVFTFQFPAGVGIYWIVSTLFSFLQTMLLYKLYSPARVAAMDAKKPKKQKKPGLYQRALEAQKAQQNGSTNVETSSYFEESDEKLSKSAVKDLQRQKLNDARRRMAEKYGDLYEEADE